MVGCGTPGDWLAPDLSSMSTLHDFVSWMRRILYCRNPQGGSELLYAPCCEVRGESHHSLRSFAHPLAMQPEPPWGFSLMCSIQLRVVYHSVTCASICNLRTPKGFSHVLNIVTCGVSFSDLLPVYVILEPLQGFRHHSEGKRGSEATLFPSQRGGGLNN